MTRIVFLDIDGVLNRHNAHPRTNYCGIERDLATLLDTTLHQLDAQIVLVSSWRYLVLSGVMTLEGLRNLLHTHWLDGRRLMDIVRADAGPNHTDRGQQISEWLQEHPRPEHYVVLDDLDLDIRSAGHPLVQTDGKAGLTAKDVEQMMRLLGWAD